MYVGKKREVGWGQGMAFICYGSQKLWRNSSVIGVWTGVGGSIPCRMAVCGDQFHPVYLKLVDVAGWPGKPSGEGWGGGFGVITLRNNFRWRKKKGAERWLEV